MTPNQIIELMEASARLGIERLRVGDVEFQFKPSQGDNQPTLQLTQLHQHAQHISDEDMLYASAHSNSNIAI